MRTAASWLLVAMCLTVACRPAAVPATERVTVESGGWRLVGDLIVPVASGRKPAVLLLNKAAGDRTPYVDLAAALAERGIASLRLDLRGHGESTNLGRFNPDDGTAMLAGTEDDVAAARRFLEHDSRIDAARIGIVGASYSGESMMMASRQAGYAAAYVALSPGSLSEESIASIDRERLQFLLVVSRHERYLREVVAATRATSDRVELLELSGTAHASDLLQAHPGLSDLLATWLQQRLSGIGAGSRP